MPFGYAETKLWLNTLASRPNDPYESQRTSLATAYHRFRERAALLAGEIPQDLRQYTVHDVTHIDALWELADTIAGPEVSLTPTEAFVLGGAFLVHDLGMGLGAWPGGLTELQSDPMWPDVLANAMSEVTGRPPTADELADPPQEAVDAATEIMLRDRHANHGAELALVAWKSLATGDDYRLLEDSDLRTQFGPLIGEIASSHGWDLSRVAARFGNDRIGAPVNCPDDWTVDPLKLACLMRVADASHLDERRAPGFLRAVRRPKGYSDLHWAFQGHLQRAHRVDDRLIFTSARPFEQKDAAAWWLCLDSLRMVDGELASVDALLVDRARDRFAARAVKGVEEPNRLAELIPTSGWEPVSAEVTITDVPSLVRKLGGESLYGNGDRVALRELIQNARDASHAASAILGTPTPAIVVRLERDGSGDYWLSVTDAGIGMSKEVITGPLLDFGTSYWGSDLMRRESTGLSASGFQSIGHFGIGFYSVFMLGDTVQITSRRFDEASSQTKVLEFSAGVAARPIYRSATSTEVRHVGGTSVRVKLRGDPFAPDGLMMSLYDVPFTLHQLCGVVAPTLDVDLDARELDGPVERVVSANDWIDMDAKALIRRLNPLPDERYARSSTPLSLLAERMRTVEKDGVVVGRMVLSPSSTVLDDDGSVQTRSVATIGGLNTEERIGGIAGVALAEATTADRLRSQLFMDRQAWSDWSTEQSELWAEEINEGVSSSQYDFDLTINLLARLGTRSEATVIARHAGGLLTACDLRDWLEQRDEVIVVNDFEVDLKWTDDDEEEMWHRDSHQRLILDENILLPLGTGGRFGSWELLGDDFPDKTFAPPRSRRWELRTNMEWYYHSQLDQNGAIARNVAAAWGQTLQELLEQPTFDRGIKESRIGTTPEGVTLDGSIDWRVSRHFVSSVALLE